MKDNLELQGSTYHVRLAVPADVRKAFGGRKILSRSLETGLRLEAMNRRLPFLTKWKGEIAAARAQIKDLKENWRPEVASQSLTFDKHVDAALLAAIKAPPRDRIKDIEVLTARLEQLERDQEDLIRDAEIWEQDGPKGIADQIRNHFQSAPASMIEVVHGAANLARSVEAQMVAHKYGLTPAEAAEAKVIVADPTVYKPKSPITKARLESFRAYRKARNISAKNIDAQESKLEKLSAFLATTGKPLDFDCVSAWLDSIDAASKTKQQYLNAGNTFWKWAMKYDARWREDYKGATTPFENHDLPQLRGKGKVDAQRVAFELGELSTLYAAAHDKKLHALADLILLGAYSGARIEEICQLRVEHVITPDGVQSFNIVDSKTAAGIRVVPVHPALTALVKRLMDDSKDGYLVPSDSKNKYGIRSDLMSKAFGRLKKELGFGEFHVFHSIRKTVITQLVRASVTGMLIAELVGHETGTVTYDVYSQGHSAAQKLEAISKLPPLPS
ncbi:tyrosine-type recombinase/integrase [Pseudomonas sp. GNP012]|jgi:integrase